MHYLHKLRRVIKVTVRYFIDTSHTIHQSCNQSPIIIRIYAFLEHKQNEDFAGLGELEHLNGSVDCGMKGSEGRGQTFNFLLSPPFITP